MAQKPKSTTSFVFDKQIYRGAKVKSDYQSLSIVLSDGTRLEMKQTISHWRVCVDVFGYVHNTDRRVPILTGFTAGEDAQEVWHYLESLAHQQSVEEHDRGVKAILEVLEKLAKLPD